MGKIGEQITVVVTAIIGLAVLAVILSRQANTTGVVTAAGQGFDALLNAAVSPVAGNHGLNF